MRFGFRRPSIRKRIAARTSLKRIVKNSLGLKAPRGYGWITNPKKFMYNKVYTRTTRGIATGKRSGCLVAMILFLGFLFGIGYLAIFTFHRLT
jgi:hypothetical protein